MPTPPPGWIDLSSVATDGWAWAINTMLPVFAPVLAMVGGISIAVWLFSSVVDKIRGEQDKSDAWLRDMKRRYGDDWGEE